MAIDCYECRGLGDDYYMDENGEWISACDGCVNNDGLVETVERIADEMMKALPTTHICAICGKFTLNMYCRSWQTKDGKTLIGWVCEDCSYEGGGLDGC